LINLPISDIAFSPPLPAFDGILNSAGTSPSTRVPFGERDPCNLGWQADANFMQHVFIVTYGRSGSTVIQNLLNTIPGYCIRGENGGLLNALLDACVGFGETRKERASKRSQRDPWFGIAESDPAALRKGLAEVFESAVLAPPPDCRTTGFKSIRFTPLELDDGQFTRVIDFLLEEFTDSRIVFNTRDPAEVARSSWWADWPASEVIGLVETTMKRFASAHERHPQSTFRIDHSDYDGRPEGLTALLDWLGERLPEDVVARVASDRLTHMQPRLVRIREMIARPFR
jgi:hypothetical protein